MAEVVFLSNTNIQIASGSSTSGGVKVSKLFSAPLPEGAVLNGVVMDKERLTQTIKTAWQSNKLPKSEVTLIINSPQLRANRIDAPILPDKKTTEFIGRETRDTEYGRFTNPVTGWYLISKNTKAKQQKLRSPILSKATLRYLRMPDLSSSRFTTVFRSRQSSLPSSRRERP